ncbi:MAG: cobalamin biosynthesis protein [Rhodobacteraceae bacterium]|nr:cobalamin biosynthesis protein [Paracoccaceae bacterium]TVR44566.1 MAG: precorrin methylase [Paracoccaceae bacterium]
MIVAGFGCTSQAAPATLRAMLGAATEITALACPEARRGLVAPLADALGLPLIALPRAALAGIATPTHSARSMAAYGTGSVAEACALVAAGPGARLIRARVVSDDGQATCALAEGMGR